MTQYWMLPEDMIELLPDEAAKAENIRRRILDLMQSWGYRLVIPPLVEFLDSLLAGSGEDLDVQTFKITDRQSGRLMGIRADMTPQIARIDAHRLCAAGESRYAYCDSVLRTRSESTEPRRNPQIIGAELFGVQSVSGDTEIMALLLNILEELHITDSVLDIGHAGIFAGMVQYHQLSPADKDELHHILLGKRRPDLSIWQQHSRLSDACIEDVNILIDAHLFPAPLHTFANHFAGKHPFFDRALEDLQQCTLLKTYYPEQRMSIDIGNVGNYGYHSGLMFSLYADGYHGALARGGRYDGVGQAYGRARPATGFSADLLTLVELAPAQSPAPVTRTCPYPQTAEDFSAIKTARSNGHMIRFEHEE